MIRPLRLFIFLLAGYALVHTNTAYSQSQACPVNISFSSGDIFNWNARTGLVAGASTNYPAPNSGVSLISEYGITTTGIRVISTPTLDLYGSFSTVPVINGYTYNHSVKLGSDATSWDLHSGTPNPGGFTRLVSYTINVPPGSVTVPYTMTYAYAMVLENGTHNSNQQPLFKATLQTDDSIVTCASPKYFLPTHDDAGDNNTGATLDTAAALANGFSLSPVLFLSHAGTNNAGGTLLNDVWYKSWTEVTFDLSPYRGKTVYLTFEADNCTPGAHFAYAYVAVRNTCAGLEISGNPAACTGTSQTYSVPALANATYTWTVPAGWIINSGAGTNIINVTPGTGSGQITIREVNGCADLRDTLDVTASPPTVPGSIASNNTVCAGNNSTSLLLGGEVGTILNWISSTDGVNWTPIANTTHNYTAQNLNTTTWFSALIQNGPACKVDTSLAAIITVDPKSAGGTVGPSNTNVCLNENTTNTLTLSGHTGTVQNWQYSYDNSTWQNFSPVNSSTTYTTNSISQTTYYRSIVKSGVCPADTSKVASITFFNVPYPVASIDPDNASICYGRTTPVNAVINTGTSYTWTNASTLTNQGNGQVTSLPFTINAVASPKRTTDYVLSVLNAGCPNALKDTFHVIVADKISVFAGNDTFVVAGQPVQLNATASDTTAKTFLWTPAFGLNNPNIYNPVATLGTSTETIVYIVRATNPQGCYGEDNIVITVFKTGPDIFVPTAFTPNGDGKNDIIKPICVGIRNLNFFRLYNRWGQLVFSTSSIGKGWDGLIDGKMQGTNTYVFMVQGVDYTGKTIFKKGTTTLIR